MLCVVPSVPSSCTFIKLYQTVVNIKIDPEEIVTGCFGRIRENSWTNGLQARRAILKVYIRVFSAYLSRASDNGC